MAFTLRERSGIATLPSRPSRGLSLRAELPGAERLAPRGPAWSRAWRWTGGAVLFALAVVAPLLRQVGTASWHSIFAEDGPVYTQQAIQHGGIAVLLRGYAGYLQLPPRLLGALAPYVPYRHLTIYLALAATVTAASLAWFVLWASKGWIASVPMRFVLAALIVVSPVMGKENTANITNTIWLFAAVAPWALVSLQERRRDSVIRAIVAFLAATATALSFVFLPLAIGWVVVRRTRSALVVASSFAAGLAVQGLVMLHTPERTSLVYGNSRSLAQLRDGISVRVFGEFLTGPNPLHPLWLHDWRALVIGAPAVTLLLLAVALLGAGRRAQLMAATLAACAVATFSLAIWSRGTWELFLREGAPLADATMRYSVVPVFLLASAFMVALAPVGVGRRPAARWASWVLVAQLCVVMVVNFPTHTIDSHQTSWHREVSRIYVTRCDARPTGRLVTIPEFLPLVVPCHQLRE